MRNTSLVLAAALIGVLSGQPLLAQGVRCDLKKAEIADSACELVALSNAQVAALSAAPATVKKLPPSIMGVQYAYFTVRIGETDLQLALNYSLPTAKLYTDITSPGDLSGPPLTSYTTAAKKVVFPTFEVKGPNGRKISVKVEAVGPKCLTLYPGTSVTGTVKLEGRSYQVFVVDGDLDGSYDHRYAGVSERLKLAPHDIFGIVPSGNQRFDAEADGRCAVMPLPKCVGIDKAFYNLTVAADGASLEFTKTAVETGTLSVAGDCVEVLACSENGSYRLTGGKKQYVLPVGTYAVQTARLLKTDGSGVHWSLEVDKPGKTKTVTIAKGVPATLTLGQPLVGKVDIKKGEAKKTLSLGFEISGIDGEVYASQVLREGQKMPTPRFKIVDENSKTIAQGGFVAVGSGCG